MGNQSRNVRHLLPEKRRTISLPAPRRKRASEAIIGRVTARRRVAILGAASVDANRRLDQLTRDERRRLIETLVRGPLPWNGHEGYAKAEVTGGGVSLDEIEPATMQSRKVPGLFLCGEVLDAFGPIGGHNFQWAWSTGRSAGIGAARGRGR